MMRCCFGMWVWCLERFVRNSMERGRRDSKHRCLCGGRLCDGVGGFGWFHYAEGYSRQKGTLM